VKEGGGGRKVFSLDRGGETRDQLDKRATPGVVFHRGEGKVGSGSFLAGERGKVGGKGGGGEGTLLDGEGKTFSPLSPFRKKREGAVFTYIWRKGGRTNRSPKKKRRAWRKDIR